MVNKKKKKFVRDARYGDIPLIEVKIQGFDGKEYIRETFDPNYTPALPLGAIRGNVKLQHFCDCCHVPKYFYVNSQRECLECNQPFLFTAKEQKFWYESLKFNFHSQAIRCPSCRKQKRTAKNLAKQKSLLLTAYEEHPRDPLIMIALAEVICSYYQIEKGGDLNFAISLSRKASQINSSLLECLYWEGLAQYLQGHLKKTQTLLEKFIELSKSLPKYKNLHVKATLLMDSFR